MVAGGANTRRLSDWIKSWEEFSSIFSTPLIFRRWTAISILAGVLQRKVWARTKGSSLYPNLYVILAGEPGVGKGESLGPAQPLLGSMKTLGIHIAPSYVTAASLADTLYDAKVLINKVNGVGTIIDEFHHLNIVSTELQNFLYEYDAKFMGILTDVYDGKDFSFRLRTGKVDVSIERPLINMIAGTTPSYINSWLPEGAWDQGFTSRTIFVYSGERVKVNIFNSDTVYAQQEGLRNDLAEDLKTIADGYGLMSWSDEAATALTNWYEADLPPVPEHSKLRHYNSRRLTHAIKLCIIAAMARSNSRLIEICDFQSAQNWLIEAEATMPDLFASHGVGGDSRAMEEAFHYVFKYFTKEKALISDSRLWSVLRERIPSHNIGSVIESMVKSGMVIRDYNGAAVGYRPGILRH